MSSQTGMLTAVRPVARRVSRAHRRRTTTALLFLAPSLAVLAVFTLWPMVQAAYLSLTQYNLLTPPKWIGLENYIKLAQDPQVLNALVNTVIYTVAVVPITVVLALLFAMFLNQAIPLRGLFRTAIFLPFIVSLAVASYAWTFLLDPNIGLVAYWLNGLGVGSTQSWVSDPNMAMVAVVMVGIWKNVGFYTVIYLAGVQSIPGDVIEAARIDGTGAVQRFFRITLPLLANQTMLVSIMALIATFQAFDQIYVMTQGGPFFKTETLVMLIYRVGFNDLQFGYGAAISYVLLGIVLLFSILQFVFFRRKSVTY